VDASLANHTAALAYFDFHLKNKSIVLWIGNFLSDTVLELAAEMHLASFPLQPYHNVYRSIFLLWSHYFHSIGNKEMRYVSLRHDWVLEDGFEWPWRGLIPNYEQVFIEMPNDLISRPDITKQAGPFSYFLLEFFKVSKFETAFVLNIVSNAK
jgi:hypothetical protein